MTMELVELELISISFLHITCHRSEWNPKLGLACKWTDDHSQRARAHLMNRNPVNVVHLVKLVDADYAPVSQHHGTCFQPLLPCRGTPEMRDTTSLGCMTATELSPKPRVSNISIQNLTKRVKTAVLGPYLQRCSKICNVFKSCRYETTALGMQQG